MRRRSALAERELHRRNLLNQRVACASTDARPSERSIHADSLCRSSCQVTPYSLSRRMTTPSLLCISSGSTCCAQQSASPDAQREQHCGADHPQGTERQESGC